MDTTQIPLTSLPYLVLVLGLCGLIFRKIWVGTSGFPPLDALLGAPLKTTRRQVFQSIVLSVFLVFFIAHTWMLGTAPHYPDASVGADHPWTYGAGIYYLKPHAYAVLQDLEIAWYVTLAAFVAEVLWSQRKRPK